MTEKKIIYCNYCQKTKSDLYCTACSSQKLKEISQQNNIKANDITQKYANLPRNFSAESLQIAGMLNKIKASNRSHKRETVNNEIDSLKKILNTLREKKANLQSNITQLRNSNLQLHQSIKESEGEKEQIKMKNLEKAKSKTMSLRRIYNTHHVFPNLQVPIRMKIVEDEFLEATQIGVKESQHFSLDISGFANLKGMSKRHSNLISDMLERISELVLHIGKVQLVTLPVRMIKKEGRFWFSFHNDESKVYELNLNQDTHENTFFQAISLLFTNFMYLNKILGVKLHIPINLENDPKNDILNLNPLLDKLVVNNVNSLSKQEELIMNSEIPLDIINLGKKKKSFENEFEIIDDADLI